MSETERLIVSGLVTLLLLFTPGFVLHEAPRFPGSLAGGILGIAGAILMVLLLVYPLVKHLSWLRRSVTKRVSMRTILSFHVYAGVSGAVLGIVHTGHKFQSTLGITLIASMLIVVLSGLIGRYYMAHLTMELREQKIALDGLRAEYDRIAARLAGTPMAGSFFGFRRLVPGAVGPDVMTVPEIVTAIADLEFAMRQREGIKRTFTGWMFIHITAAIVMYSALGLHIWNGVYFGLRWLQ